ncbi:RNA 2'-phosphotransferase [Aquimarina rhabdastrellae]
MKHNHIKISKFLSLILRHKPQTIGIQLDKEGWTSIDILLQKANKRFPGLNREILYQVVAQNDKKRFSLNEDKTLIRASQGHSVKVDLGYQEQKPPAILYHGTIAKFLPVIQEQGLLKMQRHHVHLSEDIETATKVGSRRGKPVILTIDAKKMHESDIKFYRSQNGVWLTDHVPSLYIKI